MEKMFEIRRYDKTHFCSCCGKKIEPKVARINVYLPLGGRLQRLCWSCANDILVSRFMKEK